MLRRILIVALIACLPMSSADIKVAFGTATDFTITMASLAAGSARESTSVANTANYLNAFVRAECSTAAGTPIGSKLLRVYAYGSMDGTKWPDSVTGSDAAITLNNPTQLQQIGVLNMPTGATAFRSDQMNVGLPYGGTLPAHFGIVIVNETGVALTSVEADCNFQWQGIYATSN